MSGNAQAETTLSLGLALGLKSHYGVAAKVFAEQVAKLSDKGYQIQLYPDSALGGEREMVVGVQIGTLDLAICSTGPIGSFVPATLITDIPFLFRDYAHARAVLDGPIGREILAKFPEHGLIALAWGENGLRHLTNNLRPVLRPADLKGLKIRTMQNAVHVRAFTTLGAEPVPMAYPGLYTALRDHVVDGEENSIAVILDDHMATVQKHLSLTGHVYSPAVFLMSPRQWQKLPESNRALFRTAAQAAAAAMRAEVDRNEREGVATLRADGMTVITDIDKAAFQAALKPAYAYYGTLFGQDRIDRIRNTRP